MNKVFIPDYIISNSRHGWMFIMVINIMIKVFKVALAQWLSFSTIEGIVPSCCRLTTRYLGATLFKLRLHQICKSHVAASMHHAPCQQFKVQSFLSITLKGPLLSW